MSKHRRFSFMFGAPFLGAMALHQTPSANYDESKVPPYVLPDPLVRLNGKKGKDAKTWQEKRRPEILGLFYFRGNDLLRYSHVGGFVRIVLRAIFLGIVGLALLILRAGEYPSGGPHPYYLEVGRATARNIDFYSTDIYWPNFEPSFRSRAIGQYHHWAILPLGNTTIRQYYH
jgi:hypothetical protein